MCLYLFKKAHTEATTSDLKISKNIMVIKAGVMTKHPVFLSFRGSKFEVRDTVNYYSTI